MILHHIYLFAHIIASPFQLIIFVKSTRYSCKITPLYIRACRQQINILKLCHHQCLKYFMNELFKCVCIKEKEEDYLLSKQCVGLN